MNDVKNLATIRKDKKGIASGMDLERNRTRIKDQDVRGKQELVFKCSCGRRDADWKIPKLMLTRCFSFLPLFSDPESVWSKWDTDWPVL